MSLPDSIQRNRGWLFSLYAMGAGFITYFAMYGFRKPFSVGRYDGNLEILDGVFLDTKILFIFSQVIGYTLSKFLGIKFVSESSYHERSRLILLFISVSWLALLAFALAPPPLQAVCLFFNGLPLGMIWGLVFSFLEGRHATEVLAAGLSTSYIVASGMVKSVGRWTMSLGIPEDWMPAITGLVFTPVLLLGLWMLSRIPPPSAEDEATRTRRAPMDRSARRAFFRSYAPGLICLTLFYMLLTAYRDIRDNFSREIWDELGFADQALVFTSSEVPVALFVLVTLALVMFIRDNRRAVTVIHGLLVGGALLIGLATLAFEAGWLSPLAWMIAVGIGLYLGYVPFGSVIFDRIIAETRFVGTAAFMIYVTDAFGYLGSVGLMFYKNFAQTDMSWLGFFTGFSYVTSIACAAGFFFSLVYFARKASV